MQGKAILNVRLSSNDLDRLRVIAEKRKTVPDEPVSLAATARNILREYLHNGEDASNPRGGNLDEQRTRT